MLYRFSKVLFEGGGKSRAVEEGAGIGDIIDCELDLVNMAARWTKNGKVIA